MGIKNVSDSTNDGSIEKQINNNDKRMKERMDKWGIIGKSGI